MTEQWAVPAATRLVVHLDIAVVRPILRIVLSCVGCYSTHYREGGDEWRTRKPLGPWRWDVRANLRLRCGVASRDVPHRSGHVVGLILRI